MAELAPLCLSALGGYRSGLKQIKFVLHLPAHKATELGLRVWVVD